VSINRASFPPGWQAADLRRIAISVMREPYREEPNAASAPSTQVTATLGAVVDGRVQTF